MCKLTAAERRNDDEEEEEEEEDDDAANPIDAVAVAAAAAKPNQTDVTKPDQTKPNRDAFLNVTSMDSTIIDAAAIFDETRMRMRAGG